jgi:hypothetical protein
VARRPSGAGREELVGNDRGAADDDGADPGGHLHAVEEGFARCVVDPAGKVEWQLEAGDGRECRADRVVHHGMGAGWENVGHLDRVLG